MSESRLALEQTNLIQRFDLQVAQAGQSVDQEFEVEAGASRILGILLTSDREDLMFYRGSQEIRVSNQELCPEGYESKLLMSGLNVPPHERFHEADFSTGNRQVDVKYQDTDHPRATFTPYRVSLYLFMETDD